MLAIESAETFFVSEFKLGSGCFNSGCRAGVLEIGSVAFSAFLSVCILTSLLVCGIVSGFFL
jgi:hypothetical protein